MKGRLLCLGLVFGRDAAAYVVDGRLEDLVVAPPPDKVRVGTIFEAVVGRPAKGMGGAYIDLPDGQRGFLRRGKGSSVGDRLLVQVTGYPEAGKAIPLSAKVALRGRYVVLTPGVDGRNFSRQFTQESRDQLSDVISSTSLPPGCGLIVRSEAIETPPDVVRSEISILISRLHVLKKKGVVPGPSPREILVSIWPREHAIDDEAGSLDRAGVYDFLDKDRSYPTPLDGGGMLFVEATRALVAVDVNTGGDTSPAAGLKANLAAARSLPRVLRCAGLGGQVTIDFAPFAKKDRRTLENALGKAFRDDPVSSTLAGWTPLGHFELHRRRERLPLEEQRQ